MIGLVNIEIKITSQTQHHIRIICHQYLMQTPIWSCLLFNFVGIIYLLFPLKLCSTTQTLVPQDNWAGMMISAFTSHELGFGFSISQSVLDKVNKIRAARTIYTKNSYSPHLNSFMNLNMGRIKKGIGHTTTCLYSSKTVLTCWSISTQILIFASSLTTAMVMIDYNLMV